VSHSNSPIDPIVEILRLAYRRGLALRQEQTQEKQTTLPKRVVEDFYPDVEHKESNERIITND
jgi:hypothetical protein